MTEDDKEINNMLMEQLSEDCSIDLDEEITLPPVALSFGMHDIYTKTGKETVHTPIGTYGNFSFIQAPPKTKKTFLISLLTSVYLSNNNKFGGSIEGHRKDKEVLYFDTEQGNWHVQNVCNRVMKMTNDKGKDKFKSFGLRQLSFKTRIDLIEYQLSTAEDNSIGLVIIDGIADLVSDVNNIAESNLCVQKVMEWSSKYNCHIITVIHSNFGSHKATGHLGSFLAKKTETQIRLEANTVNHGWVKVECQDSRNRAFEQFNFKVNDYGYPEIIDNLYDPLKGMKSF